MKETFYFPHDYNARADRKLVKLLMKHGMEGIGVYWCLVEMLYEEGGYIPLEYDRITFELRTTDSIIQSTIIDSELFENDGTNFWSPSVITRLGKRAQKSEKARKSIQERWNKYERKTNVLQSNDERNTIKEKKGEEIKEEKNINFEFDTFWNLYDKKVGDKTKLIKKWTHLTDEERQTIIDYIPKYIKARPDKQFRKDPETFLNNKGWNDEIIKRTLFVSEDKVFQELDEIDKKLGIK